MSEHKVTFGTLSPDGKLTDVRLIRQSSMQKCPHFIAVPEHYNPDESCRCTDPDHKEMSEWGYIWDGSSWISPGEEE